MKQLVLALVICFLSKFVAGQSPYDTIRYAPKHYQKRVALFESETVAADRVIILGNSLVEFGNWKLLLRDTTVVNRGIAGDNTFGVLERIDEVIDRSPRMLLIEIGINDISQDIPGQIIVENIFSIISQVKKKSPATTICVHSILPTNDNVKNEYPDAYNKNHIADSVNAMISKRARKLGFTFVDLNKELRGPDGKLNSTYADPDGLHLNEAGYQLWATLLKKKKMLSPN